MTTETFAPVLSAIYREVVHGSPDPSQRTYLLNQGDRGLLATLDRLSAAEASAAGTGATIAAHADHLRYGLSLLNRWAAGDPAWAQDKDWTVSWRTVAVTDADWAALRHELRREATAWGQAVRASREVTEIEACWIAGSVSHIAYHLGAIRQIAAAARGPTAEDEVRAQAESQRP